MRHLPNGRLTDLLWTIAPASVLVAVRLSRAPVNPGSQITTASLGLRRSLDPVRVGSLLVAGTFTFPAGHLFLQVATGYRHGMEDALHVVALAAMSVLGALAIVANRRLEAQRAGLERVRSISPRRPRRAGISARPPGLSRSAIYPPVREYQSPGNSR